MNKDELDLNAPAFTEDSEEQTEFNQPLNQEEEKVSPSPAKEAVADEAEQEVARIPYSRFEKVNERAIQAETEARLLKEQLEALNGSKEESVDVPKEWLEMYGDNDQARQAWDRQLIIQKRFEEEAIQKAKEAVREERQESEKVSEQNLNHIEDNLAQFETTLGRKLSEDEESGILDVQDEFTPKNEKGEYVTDLMSPEKAFEIYSLRQNKNKVNNSQARRRVVSLTSVNSDNSDTDQNNWADWRPGETGVWRKRLNN